MKKKEEKLFQDKYLESVNMMNTKRNKQTNLKRYYMWASAENITGGNNG